MSEPVAHHAGLPSGSQASSEAATAAVQNKTRPTLVNRFFIAHSRNRTRISQKDHQRYIESRTEQFREQFVVPRASFLVRPRTTNYEPSTTNQAQRTRHNAQRTKHKAQSTKHQHTHELLPAARRRPSVGSGWRSGRRVRPLGRPDAPRATAGVPSRATRCGRPAITSIAESGSHGRTPCRVRS